MDGLGMSRVKVKRENSGADLGDEGADWGKNPTLRF